MTKAEMLRDLQRMGKDVAEYQNLNKAAVKIHYDKGIQERIQANFQAIRNIDIRSNFERY